MAQALQNMSPQMQQEFMGVLEVLQMKDTIRLYNKVHDLRCMHFFCRCPFLPLLPVSSNLLVSELAVCFLTVF